MLYIEDALITVGYEFTTYHTTESMRSVILSIILFDPPTGGSLQPFTLYVNTRDGTAGLYQCA